MTSALPFIIASMLIWLVIVSVLSTPFLILVIITLLIDRVKDKDDKE